MIATALIILLSVVPLSAGPLSAAKQPSRPPPGDAQERMPREVRLGKDRGFSAWLRPVEITDRRFNPFVISIRLSSDSSLGLRKVKFATQFGDFTSEIALQNLPKQQGPAFGNTPRPSANATLTIRRIEDRSFNIDLAQAGWLARTETLEVTVTGRLRERSYTVGKKALSRLRKWLLPRVEKYEN